MAKPRARRRYVGDGDRTSRGLAACAFLRSVQAGYILGVNLHLDGGSYVGLV